MGHAVHILLRIQLVADLVLVCLQVLGQRPEHQYAVDGIVGIDLFDGSDQGVLVHIARQQEVYDLHAHQFGTLGSTTLVRQVAGVFAAADDSQSGLYALGTQSGSPLLQICIQCIGNFFTQ